VLAPRAFGFERGNLLLNGVDWPPAPSLLPGPLQACFPLQRLLRGADALARRRGVDEARMRATSPRSSTAATPSSRTTASIEHAVNSEVAAHSATRGGGSAADDVAPAG